MPNGKKEKTDKDKNKPGRKKTFFNISFFLQIRNVVFMYLETLFGKGKEKIFFEWSDERPSR